MRYQRDDAVVQEGEDLAWDCTTADDAGRPAGSSIGSQVFVVLHFDEEVFEFVGCNEVVD